MVGIALTYTTLGIDALQVTVECDSTGSMTHNVNIVGMPSNLTESQLSLPTMKARTTISESKQDAQNASDLFAVY